jgi:hypothetical protein
MSTLRKMTILCSFLILLAVFVPTADSASASAGSAATSADIAATQPSAGVVGIAPVASGNPSARELAVLNIRTTGTRAAIPVLVIPGKPTDAETSNRIVEDLTVMGRIIEKGVRAAAQEGYGAMMPGDPLYGQAFLFGFDGPGPRILRTGDGRPRPMYIGGYGAIFFLQVDFPLVPPPQEPEADKATEKTDQVWAAAQRELADPQAATRTRPGAVPGKPYRAEAVEGLRTALTDLLKHATNIRDLEPESWLTVLVQGPDSTAQGQTQTSAYGQGLVLPSPRASGRALLTLRAKKADIDLYAKGQLDPAQFQQRVQIATH